jgi:two-component system response regulator DesR
MTRVRVVVVDDSLAVRARLVPRLREAELVVVGEGGTAAEALALARAHDPDGVVLDVLLPDRHGLDVVPALRLALPGAVIVILSNAPEYRRHCLALGADAFLDKSREFDIVAATLVRLRPSR